MKKNYGWWGAKPEPRRRDYAAQQFPFTPEGILVPTSKGDKPLTSQELEQILVGLRGQRVLFLMGLVQWGLAMKEFVHAA